MFTLHQMDTLQALVNCMIPPDDDPGGWEAGVGDYLLRQFERDLKPLLPFYRVALDALDAEAQAVHHHDFCNLSPEAQDALLRNIEARSVKTDWPVDPAGFVRAAAEHCAEGFYGDPANGGNRNGAGWAMIGFEVTA